MKKGFMLSLLALCTSAAFAHDVSPIAPHKRTSNANAQAANGAKKDVSTSASDRTTKSDVKATAANSVKLPSMSAVPIGTKNDGTMRDVLCDGALYESNPWDGVNGWFNSRSGIGIEARGSVDADFDNTTVVAAIHWEQLDVPGQTDVTTGDLLVGPDTGNCLPSDDDSSAYVNVTDVPVCRVLTGDLGFGYYEVAVYTINYNVKVAAGKSWWSARSVNPSTYGYWCTANSGAPEGCDSAWRGSAFGYPNWVSMLNVGGQATDFAICLTGSGGGAGACCNDGECADGVDPEKCKANGGEYQGDGSFCCSTVCRGGPQACCYPDGSCQNLKPNDCTGEPQGDGVLCAPGLCPLPDLCADSIFNQFGYDGVNGLDSQDSGDIGWIDAWVADNATLISSSDITGAVWQTVDRGSPTVSVVDYEIDYTAGAGGPGATISSGDNVAYDVRVITGSLFGGDIVTYVVTTTTTSVVPGSYYVALRPRIDSFVQSFWLTAAGDGIPGYFKSKFFGQPNWVSVSTQLGYDADFSFCLLGVAGVGPYGACCVDDQSFCIITSEDRCNGVYYGDDTTCSPSPCPNQPGACCHADGTCEVTKPNGCDGDFQGSGTDCTTTKCPLPDACEGNLYSQFGYDGFNGLDNQDSADVGWIEAWTADDANVLTRGYATGVVAQNVTRGTDPVNAEDAFLAYDSGAGPGVLIADVNDTTSFTHLTDGSTIFGGTIWVDKVDIPATAIVPGEYYCSAREKIDNFVQSFLLTSSSGGGLESYFKSTFFGLPNWVPTSSQLGSDGSFSFCLLGKVSDSEFGACCIEDESVCVLVSESDCRGMGGRYVGTDVPCFPVQCTNVPGACCFLDPFGCEDGLTEGKCEGLGGVFQGGSTDCASVHCPLPDFCADAIYSQFGYDGINGLDSQDSDQVGWIEAWAADDMTVSGYYEVTGIVAQTIDRGNPNVYAADAFLSYTSGGGGPGASLNDTDDTTSFIRATDGTPLFGGTIYILAVDLSSPTRIASGQYYGSARPVFDDFQQSFLLTTGLGGGSDSYFKSAFFGVPNWQPSSSQLGVNGEFSLCFLGNTTDPFGACCTEGDAICSLLNAVECKHAGGNYHGDGTICAPNPCPNAPGACCLESGECVFVTPAGCDDAGGVFQGGDVLCEQIACPLPDPCDGSHGDVFYNNSTPDGANGLTSEDSSSVGFIDSYTADDFTLGAAVTVDGLHWYDLTSPGATFDGNGDYILLGDTGAGPDDGNIEASANDTPVTALATGGTLFGLNMNQCNFTGVNAPLGAATHWVALRRNLTSFSREFWATAPSQGQNAYIKSAFFGYPNWTNWNQLGITADVAFCITGPTAPCSGVVLGDSDGDGDVDFDDIDCFVSALIDADTWADCGTGYAPGAYLCANDINNSGAVDFDDIDPFVVCLANDGCP